MIDDVAYIISTIPNLHEDKAEEASLYLFAVSCGARGSSCDGVEVKDIIRVISSDMKTFSVIVCIFSYSTTTYNMTQIRLTQTKTKEIHDVNFKGDITQPHNMVFVHWLDKHLRQNFDLSLEKLAKEGLDSIKYDTRKLWKWNKTCMSFKFRYSNEESHVMFITFSYRNRSEMAGYPEKFFSFHSLRSGMIGF